ncbi:MAG: PfkB family carbohydrate kinase [Acidobacteriota bacterium]
MPAVVVDRLLELVDRFEDQPVAMLVDLVLDRFISGEPKRISREAPVLILRYDGETAIPGGGANAVANVAALGGRPIPFGVVGDDASGETLRRIFSDRGIATDGVIARSGYRTPTKTRILGGGRHAIKQQIVRYDVEDTWEPSRDDIADLASRVQTLASDARAVVLSDYGYGAARPEMLAPLRQALADVPILGDSRYRLGDFRGLDGATPNLEEAEGWLGRSLDDEAELVAGGPELLGRLDSRFLLVTRGSAGMSLFGPVDPAADGDLPTVHLPVHGTDQVADVTGAGDTVIGTFSLALAAGASPLEAACLANYAGGIVVMKMGTATLDRDELRHAIRSDPEWLANLR